MPQFSICVPQLKSAPFAKKGLGVGKGATVAPDFVQVSAEQNIKIASGTHLSFINWIFQIFWHSKIVSCVNLFFFLMKNF